MHTRNRGTRYLHPLAGLLATAGCLLVFPGAAGASYTYPLATPGDDTIYFGYCGDCLKAPVAGTYLPAVKFCLYDGSGSAPVLSAVSFVAVGGGTLRVPGYNGNDRIQAVDAGDAPKDCPAGDFDLVCAAFSTVMLDGGAGNDR